MVEAVSILFGTFGLLQFELPSYTNLASSVTSRVAKTLRGGLRNDTASWTRAWWFGQLWRDKVVFLQMKKGWNLKRRMFSWRDFWCKNHRWIIWWIWLNMNKFVSFVRFSVPNLGILQSWIWDSVRYLLYKDPPLLPFPTSQNCGNLFVLLPASLQILYHFNIN